MTHIESLDTILKEIDSTEDKKLTKTEINLLIWIIIRRKVFI